MEWTGLVHTRPSALKSHTMSFGLSDIRTNWNLGSFLGKTSSHRLLALVKMWNVFPVVKKWPLHHPSTPTPHAYDLLACYVMWHFITKMDSYIPQGFSGFLPKILTAFCQFMVPTSHFSTVAERQETFNHWVWFFLSLLIFCTVLPLRALAWWDKHDRNVTSLPLASSSERWSLHILKPFSLNNHYLRSGLTPLCFC